MIPLHRSYCYTIAVAGCVFWEKSSYEEKVWAAGRALDIHTSPNEEKEREVVMKPPTKVTAVDTRVQTPPHPSSLLAITKLEGFA